MLPSTLTYLYSIEPDRMHFPVYKWYCVQCSIAHSIICTVRLFRGKIHSDWFNGIEILQGRWQHWEKVGYCYPSGLEKTLYKWNIHVPLVTKGLKSSAIITFHTDMVISYCSTQHNIKTISIEHSVCWEADRRSPLQSSVSFTDPEVSWQCSQQHNTRWIHSHIPNSIQPLHQRLGFVSVYFRISDQYFAHLSLSPPPP
jgi:hypothetical protein